jgi:polyisoprenoid-binding protein YceI
MNRKVLFWVLGGLAAVIVVVVGATVFYVQVIEGDAPEKLEFSDADDEGDDADTTDPSTPGSADAGPVETEGTWTATGETVVGYRVVEDFIGGLQDNEAVGRTSAVTGTLTIDGTTVPEATFTADLTTLESDEPQRDSQVQGRILETSTFPEATFTLTSPVDFGSVPEPDTEITASATGTLELHGVTKDVTFDVQAKIVDGHIEVLGEIPVVFADYGIDNPSNQFISTEEDGLLEFLLVLEPAG